MSRVQIPSRPSTFLRRRVAIGDLSLLTDAKRPNARGPCAALRAATSRRLKNRLAARSHYPWEPSSHAIRTVSGTFGPARLAKSCPAEQSEAGLGRRAKRVYRWTKNTSTSLLTAPAGRRSQFRGSHFVRASQRSVERNGSQRSPHISIPSRTWRILAVIITRQNRGDFQPNRAPDAFVRRASGRVGVTSKELPA